MKKSLQSILLLAAMVGLFNSGEAAILQIPLQASAGAVPPNLMFTLDDSGSMGFECLPESLCISGSNYVGAMPDGVGVTFPGGGQPWKNGVATYDKNDIFNIKMRSASVNTLYYNPEVRYFPWLKENGMRYDSYPGISAPDRPESVANSIITNLISEKDIATIWCTGPSKSNCSVGTQKVYLAQYFRLTPESNINTKENYTQVLIKPEYAPFPKFAERIDCASVSGGCSYAEEIQNFSNWYSYHRSRMRVAIAGTAEAFYSVPETYRVGYGRINDGVANSVDGSPPLTTVDKGVRPFGDATTGSKKAFYEWLFRQVPTSGGTPLRRAMDAVGQYYSYSGNKGPWGANPGIEDTAPQLACRRAFHVLMTDGLWSSGEAAVSAARANVDGSAGTSITGPDSQSFTYSAAAPYKDGYSNTLADVAMYYWKTDLNASLANGIKASVQNPAFWQHMVNYTVSFGVTGTLDPKVDWPALRSGAKSWPNPNTSEGAKIDDLWHAAVNSRGKYVQANNTVEYSNALKTIIDDIATVNGSEAGVGVSARTVSAATNTRKYEAEFSSSKWSGEVKAIKLDASGAEDGFAWTAVDELPAHGSRKIFTYDKDATGTKGIEFKWNSLSSAMQNKMMGPDPDGLNPDGLKLVNYLRGERVGESGAYRPRTSPLGDIVNSTPTLVKDQLNGQYGFLPISVAGQDSYGSFLKAKKLRVAQLFVGANDGMLHAFSDVDGAETFAFMPDSILGKIRQLAAHDYSHDYFVDGPLVEADVYDSSAGKWHNIVVGGTGAGAKSLFAINVPVSLTATAPLTAAQSAPSAADILWSISHETEDFEELGHVLQVPEHGIMKDGGWTVIVGNGYESRSRKAQLFIIDALTGKLIKRLDTGVGSLASPNGLGGVRVVRNAQKQIVAAYAGDLHGNLWKFDFSSNSPSTWDVAFGSAGGARNPLYKTAVPEPIVASPTYTFHPAGGTMVLFGTGKAFEIGDDGVTAQRALYGVWDTTVLEGSSTDPAKRIASDTAIVSQALTASALTDTSGKFYGLRVTPVDYGTKRGWRLPLTIGAGQRLVDAPEMAGGLAFMQTMTPSAALAGCTVASVTRYGFLLDPFMKALEQPTFDTNDDNAFSSGDKALAVATLLTGSGPATMVREAGKNRYRLAQARTSGNPVSQGVPGSTKRYWRQIVTQPK